MESEQQQDMMVAISSELPPPEEPKRKDKKWRKHPRKGALTKRPPPRPYKRLEEPKLELRIQKLTARMERAKRQHEDARKLLTKYAHEKTYRLRDSLQEASASASEAAAPLPEFEPMVSSITPADPDTAAS